MSPRSIRQLGDDEVSVLWADGIQWLRCTDLVSALGLESWRTDNAQFVELHDTEKRAFRGAWYVAKTAALHLARGGSLSLLEREDLLAAVHSLSHREESDSEKEEKEETGPVEYPNCGNRLRTSRGFQNIRNRKM
jgi:hypothetical protein